MNSDILYVEGNLPGGVKVSGGFKENLDARAWLLFILIILQGALIYMVVLQETDRERRYSGTQTLLATILSQVAEAKADHIIMQKSLNTITTEQRVQTYVLTLDEKQRKGLNMQEPEGLRNRR